MENHFALQVRPHRKIQNGAQGVVVSESLDQVRAQATASAARERLDDLKAAEVVERLKSFLNDVRRPRVRLLVEVVVAERPIVSRAALPVNCGVRSVAPAEVVVSRDGGCALETLLDDLGLHVDEHGIRREGAVRVLGEKGADRAFLAERIAGAQLLCNRLVELLTDLVSTLANLDGDKSHKVRALWIKLIF